MALRRLRVGKHVAAPGGDRRVFEGAEMFRAVSGEA